MLLTGYQKNRDKTKLKINFDISVRFYQNKKIQIQLFVLYQKKPSFDFWKKFSPILYCLFKNAPIKALYAFFVSL